MNDKTTSDVRTTERTVPVYNLNKRRISPEALLRPNDLFTQTRKRARMAAILRDERLQLTADDAGQMHARLVPATS